MTETLKSIAKTIDHSLLHPTMTDDELKKGCQLAVQYDVASVCIKPYAVAPAKEWLSGSPVEVGTVVGFPHGNSRIDIKVKEAEAALADGATELDMVVNVGKVLSQDWAYVTEEISALQEAAKKGNAILKVIFENDFLADDQFKNKLCEICNQVDLAFVKTSTGYGFVKQDNGFYAYKGAIEKDLVLMREKSKPSIEVKAAGGVRTLDDLLHFRSLGVTRFGASATKAILEEAKKRGFN